MRSRGLNSAVSVIIVTGFVALPLAARGMHPLATDDHGTVGRGQIEIELASERVWSRDVGKGGTILLASLHAGLTDRVDVGMGLAHPLGISSGPSFAWEDPTFDAKLRLIPAGARPGLAIRLDWTPDLANDGRTGTHVGAMIIASFEAERQSVHLNVGHYSRSWGTATSHGCWCFGATATRELSPGWTAALELFAENPNRFPSRTMSALAGLVYELDERRTISVGIGPQIVSPKITAWLVSVGLTLSH